MPAAVRFCGTRNAMVDDASGQTGPPRRRHLHRLESVWVEPPIYFVTTCSYGRRPVLCDEDMPEAIISSLKDASQAAAWSVGRFVIMPDHLHFCCAPWSPDSRLSVFLGRFKGLSASRARRTGWRGSLWQAEFFDRALRSGESYRSEWLYAAMNPVEEGLCEAPEDWPHQGEIRPLRGPGL